MITKNKLDFWVASELNVLFEGKHGVGKSAIIIDTFKRNNLRYAYFSGATMDPYVDFVGIPVKVDAADGKGQVLQFIKPEYLVNLDVQALFFDELNRAHKKVRNAVMELVQFKTINGQLFSSDLKIIWAAINPDNDNLDDENVYDTDRLDPAQRDRFQIQISLPYECNVPYFTKKFGSNVARPAIHWWDKLPPKVKELISPRRLDYSLDLWKINGDISDCLPKESNPSSLLYRLANGDIEEKIKNWVATNNISEAKTFINNSNNYDQAESTILQAKNIDFFLPLLEAEKQAKLYCSNNKVRNTMLSAFIKNNEFESVLTSLKNSKLLSREYRNRLKNAFTSKQDKEKAKTLFSSTSTVDPLDYTKISNEIVNIWNTNYKTTYKFKRAGDDELHLWWEMFIGISAIHPKSTLISNTELLRIFRVLIDITEYRGGLENMQKVACRKAARKFGFTYLNI